MTTNEPARPGPERQDALVREHRAAYSAAVALFWADGMPTDATRARCHQAKARLRATIADAHGEDVADCAMWALSDDYEAAYEWDCELMEAARTRGGLS